MKANISLEIEKEDLNEELKNLVKKTAQDELRQMIKSQAKEMVKSEIDKILHPLVLQELTEGDFNPNDSYFTSPKKQTIDDKIKSMVKKHLQTPNYLYSRSAKLPSERYMVSSSSSNSPLIMHLINDSITEYVDNEFGDTIRKMVSSVIQDKEQMETILKDKAKEIVLEKMK